MTNSMHSKYVLEFLILLVFHFIFILGLRISDPDVYDQLLNSKYQEVVLAELLTWHVHVHKNTYVQQH